ncbi:hypothetical protein J8I29_15970 [Labrys sp. LIt4]|uniref:hypothetical protein n=1 Tax=Labrys sp. LIt4 TaxID=2821355 RepID=UPI001AE07C51|nr:hypothetical protein [Labrys sp. LIt4]MBP0580825.1 hypothetical protein [Labrys sp. LIt4]
MTSPTPSQIKAFSNGLLAYGLASGTFALFYWGVYLYIDSLPCRELLCNFEWILLFFGPVVAVFLVAPLANFGLLLWERRRSSTAWPLLRLAFSAIGAGFSVLVAATFVIQLARRGMAMIDLSPQSLIFAVIFLAATWINLRCAEAILRKGDICPLCRRRTTSSGHWKDAIG